MNKTITTKALSKVTHPDYLFKIITTPLRVFPNVQIIGAERSGTSTLYKYLAQHPSIIPGTRWGKGVKEIRYFTNNYYKGKVWYKCFFPIRPSFSHTQKLGIDATTEYFFDPKVPGRIYRDIPDPKLILILRDPVLRAYAHYKMNRRRKIEDRSFQEAILNEEQRIGKDFQRMVEDREAPSEKLINFSYKHRGLYFNQLSNWLDFFRVEDIFITEHRQLVDQPLQILNDLTSFLALDPFEYQPLKGKISNYDPMDEPSLKYLKAYFKEENKKLFGLIGKEYDWI